MPSRRSHSNSHHGCVQCKAKRVKCDERQPSCTRCVRRQETCAYRHLMSNHNPFRFSPYQFIGSPARSSPSRTESPPKSVSLIALASPTPSEAISSTPSPIKTEPPTSLARSAPRSIAEDKRSALDQVSRVIEPSSADLVLARAPVHLSNELLETTALFHHYSTVISQRNPNRYVFENFHLWDTAVRRHATSHGFLLNAVCALSALHLATHASLPQLRKKYLMLGLAHQTRAVEEFRPSIGHLTKDNCEAALTCGAMLVSSRFAKSIAEYESATFFAQGFPSESSLSPLTSGRAMLASDQELLRELLQIIGLCRGVVEVYNVGWSTGMDTLISPRIRKDYEVMEIALKRHEQAKKERMAMQEENHRRQQSVGPTSPLSASLRIDGNLSEASGPIPDPPPGPPPLPSDLSLLHIMRTQINHLPMMTPAEKCRKEVYSLIAAMLRLQLRVNAHNPNLHRIISALPSSVPPLFLAELTAHDPLALVMLAHWAVILETAVELWWAGGWGRRLLAVVHRALERKDAEEAAHLKRERKAGGFEGRGKAPHSLSEDKTEEMIGRWVMFISWPIWRITGRKVWEVCGNTGAEVSGDSGRVVEVGPLMSQDAHATPSSFASTMTPIEITS